MNLCARVLISAYTALIMNANDFSFDAVVVAVYLEESNAIGFEDKPYPLFVKISTPDVPVVHDIIVLCAPRKRWVTALIRQTPRSSVQSQELF
jgi:hypothetical protein